MKASFPVWEPRGETGKLEVSFWLPRKLGNSGQLPLIKLRQGAIAGGMAKLTPHEVRSIAVAAMVDPRSVRKALAKAPLHALTLTRIQRALADLGRSDLLAASTAPQPPATT